VVDTDTVTADVTSDAFRADAVVGPAVVRDHMTLFLDVYRLLDLATGGDRGAGAAALETAAFSWWRTHVLPLAGQGYLEAAGYEVVTAGNGAEGLAALDHGRFDAAVTDIEMPVMDGWALARALRQRPDGAELPLLALTTLSSDADRTRAAAWGSMATK
jgi:hypothetical protein